MDAAPASPQQHQNNDEDILRSAPGAPTKKARRAPPAEEWFNVDTTRCLWMGGAHNNQQTPSPQDDLN